MLPLKELKRSSRFSSADQLSKCGPAELYSTKMPFSENVTYHCPTIWLHCGYMRIFGGIPIYLVADFMRSVVSYSAC